MKRYNLALAAVVALVCTSAPAAVLYTNGTLNLHYGATTINRGYLVTDSFTLSSPATLKSVTVGLFTKSDEDNADVLRWSLGSSAFGNNFDTGRGNLSNQYVTSISGFGSYDVNLATFPLDVTLAAGTYWLTLSDAANASNGIVYWATSNGPSSAIRDHVNDIPTPVDSHYFSISSAAPVPEPPLAVLLGLGLAVIAGRFAMQGAPWRKAIKSNTPRWQT